MNTLEQQIKEILDRVLDFYDEEMSGDLTDAEAIKELTTLIKQRERDAYMKGLTDRLKDVGPENIVWALRQDTNFMRMLGCAAAEAFLEKRGQEDGS